MERLVAIATRVGWAALPWVTYVPQVRRLKRSAKEGFEGLTCLVVVLAACLRVAHWERAHLRDGSALAHAVGAGVVQLVLLDAIVVARRKKGGPRARGDDDARRYGWSTTKALGREVRAVVRALVVDRDVARARELRAELGRTFWAWDELAPYVEVVVVFSLSLAALSVCFIRSAAYARALGGAAAAVEAARGAPQLRRNARRRLYS